MKIAVFSKIMPDAIAELKQIHDCVVSINPDSKIKNELIQDADVVVVRSPVELDRKTIDTAEKLKLIVRAGMGLDTIDYAYAKEKGIIIVIVPLSAESVAEHTLALMLALYKHIPWYHQTLQENRWEKHAIFNHDLLGKSLGLVGFGRIGQRLAEISNVFHMNILAYDRSPEKPAKKQAAERLGVRFVSLEELSTQSDIVSIQTPLNANTRNLISEKIINLMKDSAIIVNVGRGGIVDEDALFIALDKHIIAGAASDVFTIEPPKNNPLLALDNFIGTPHAAAQTLDAQKKIGGDVVKIINAFQNQSDLNAHCIVV